MGSQPSITYANYDMASEQEAGYSRVLYNSRNAGPDNLIAQPEGMDTILKAFRATVLKTPDGKF